MLPTGSLRTHGMNFDFRIGDDEMCRNLQHGRVYPTRMNGVLEQGDGGAE